MARGGQLSEVNMLLQNGAHGAGKMGGPAAAEVIGTAAREQKVKTPRPLTGERSERSRNGGAGRGCCRRRTTAEGREAALRETVRGKRF